MEILTCFGVEGWLEGQYTLHVLEWSGGKGDILHMFWSGWMERGGKYLHVLEWKDGKKGR